jgi:hypothetical protein
MQCFKHRETPAVAICISCGAAVCSDCVKRGVGQRIVCSNLCEEQLGQLINSGREGLARATRSHAINAWYVWLLGIGLILYSVYTIFAWKNWDFVPYGVGFGVVCIAVGFFYNQLAKRTPNRSPQSDAPPVGGAPLS